MRKCSSDDRHPAWVRERKRQLLLLELERLSGHCYYAGPPEEDRGPGHGPSCTCTGRRPPDVQKLHTHRLPNADTLPSVIRQLATRKIPSTTVTASALPLKRFGRSDSSPGVSARIASPIRLKAQLVCTMAWNRQSQPCHLWESTPAEAPAAIMLPYPNPRLPNERAH